MGLCLTVRNEIDEAAEWAPAQSLVTTMRYPLFSGTKAECMFGR